MMDKFGNWKSDPIIPISPPPIKMNLGLVDRPGVGMLKPTTFNDPIKTDLYIKPTTFNDPIKLDLVPKQATFYDPIKTEAVRPPDRMINPMSPRPIGAQVAFMCANNPFAPGG